MPETHSVNTSLGTNASVPMRHVGPVRFCFEDTIEEVRLPLATYETPLWPSVARGAKVSRLIEKGIELTVVDERMTRSILLEATNAGEAVQCLNNIQSRHADLQAVVAQSSRFAKLIDTHAQIVGNLLFLRLEFTTGDASGHNMVTNAADHIMRFLLAAYPQLAYSSISGNFCSDKKATAVNGILGRGKYVVAEITIPREICEKSLRTTTEKIVDLNIKKNLIGTMMAGGLRSANAHFANMLLAFYLATGQDAANIIEGSQGVVHAEVRDGDLYFSCTLPNLIVGSVGNGKGLDFVDANLQALGCKAERKAGENGRRLAAICATSVLCGELSLLAAQTNPGELMKAHIALERKS